MLRDLQIVQARIPIKGVEFTLYAFEDTPGAQPDLALVLGNITAGQEVLTRIHSECLTGDLFSSERCDCGPQLNDMIDRLIENGQGILIYLRQEGRGIGLMKKLEAYCLQDEGYDTIEANLALGHQADERNYQKAATILQHFQIPSVALVTNNPEKITSLESYGIHVAKRVASKIHLSPSNAEYMKTKSERFNHFLVL